MTLRLLPPHSQYAEILYQWRNEPLIQKFNPVLKRSVSELKELLTTGPMSLHPMLKGTSYRWFIEFEDKVVGTVSLAEVNPLMRTAEIGYMIAQDYKGRGITTEAVRLWANKIFKETDLRKLTASVAESNFASLRVLEKVGFKKEGLLRKQYLINDIPTNQVVYGLLREEI